MEAEGKGVLSYLFTEWEGPVARQPASHSPEWPLGSIRRAVGKELGGLVWGVGVQALRLLVQFEEHLLLSLLLVQVFFQSLGQSEGRSNSDSIRHRSPIPRNPTKVPSGNFPPRPWYLGNLVFLFPSPEPVTQNVSTTSSSLPPQPYRSFREPSATVWGNADLHVGGRVAGADLLARKQPDTRWREERRERDIHRCERERH